MISELENVLKATIQYTPEYESDIRKVVVKQSNLMPNENGVIPLGKQNSFEKEEEEILDFMGPSTAGPIPAPVPTDVITDAPVLTEDPSKLEEVVKPLQDEFEKLKNKNLIQEELENTIVSPLGVQMPEIEEPLETEPTMVNESLFADHEPAQEEVSSQQMPTVELPEMPAMPQMPQVALPTPPVMDPSLTSAPQLPEMPQMPVMPASVQGPSLEDMLSPQVTENNAKSELPTMDANNDGLGVSIDDRLIKFENEIKAHLESQIDLLSADIKKMVSKGETLSTSIMNNQPVNNVELPTMSSPLPEMPMTNNMMTNQPTTQGMMGGMQMVNNPGQNQTPFNEFNQMNQTPMFNNPEPEKVDDGPIKGGGMFIQF